MNNNPGLNVAQLSSNIRKRRRELQLKQQDLVNSIYPLTYIKAVENGQQQPDDPFLVYISNILMITITDLEAGTWKKVPRKALKDKQRSQLADAELALESRQFSEVKSFLGKIKLTTLLPILQPIYYAVLGETEVELANYEAARPALQKALELYKNFPETDAIQIERVRNCIGVSYARERNFSKAVEHWKACLNAIANGLIQDSRFRMKIYLNLSSSYINLGEIKQAIVYYNEAATIAKATQEDSKLADIYWGLGMCYRTEKNYSQAKMVLFKGINLYKKLGDEKSVLMLKNILSIVLIDGGNYIEAEKCLREANDAASLPGFESMFKYIHLNRAYLEYKLERWDTAQHYATLAISESSDDKLNLGYSLSQMGRIKLAMGRKEEALKLFEEAIKVLDPNNAKEAIKIVYLRYAEALESMGRMQEAALNYRKANDLVLV